MSNYVEDEDSFEKDFSDILSILYLHFNKDDSGEESFESNIHQNNQSSTENDNQKIVIDISIFQISFQIPFQNLEWMFQVKVFLKPNKLKKVK